MSLADNSDSIIFVLGFVLAAIVVFVFNNSMLAWIIGIGALLLVVIIYPYKDYECTKFYDTD